MKKSVKRVIIASTLIVGILFLIDASTTITGNVISDVIGQTPSYIIGILSTIAAIYTISRGIRGSGEEEFDEYKIKVSDILADYKKSPSKAKAVQAVRRINNMDYPISGVDYEGDLAKISLEGQKRGIPVMFTNDKQAKPLIGALARVALQNDPDNAANISGLGRDVKKVVKEFEKSKD
jgi:hypothetical protein